MLSIIYISSATSARVYVNTLTKEVSYTFEKVVLAGCWVSRDVWVRIVELIWRLSNWFRWEYIFILGFQFISDQLGQHGLWIGWRSWLQIVIRCSWRCFLSTICLIREFINHEGNLIFLIFLHNVDHLLFHGHLRMLLLKLLLFLNLPAYLYSWA